MHCHSYSLGFLYKVLPECSRYVNVNTQLLDYNALAICTYNLGNKCDIYLCDSHCWCCYYGNKVIHNTCNMAIHDLPDTVCMPSDFKQRLVNYFIGLFGSLHVF